MPHKIALEDNLTSFAPFLIGKGLDVTLLHSLTSVPLDEFDAVVVSGQTNNFLNIQDTLTSAPVIDATGMTDEQVYQRIRRIIET